MRREGRYIDTAGRSFRDFLAGRLPELPGEAPTLKDWEDHCSTVFPEVRLKRYLEMRGADGGPWGRLCALPALWTGLLYDSTSRDDAWALCRDITAEDHARLRTEAPRLGLRTPHGAGSLHDLAREMLAVARAGLERRACTDRYDRDETLFLKTLERIAATGITPAEELLADYHGKWGETVDPVFTEHAY